MNPEKSFGEDGDKFLNEFYNSYGSQTTLQKIKLLELYLGDGQRSFHAMGGEVTNEMILGCLEYEILEREGVIELIYC